MDKEKLKEVLLNCKFEKYETDEDVRFSKAKIWVAHTGWNYNSTYFSKEILTDMAENTLGGIPLVAFLQKEDGMKDFAGHEEVFVLDENGEIKEVYLGVPYGFVPEVPEWSFETTEVDGEELEYLVVHNVKIWNKFDGSELFDENKSQSMELLPDDLEGVYTTELPSDHEAVVDGREGWYITNATFDALCALGDNYEPAMKGSVIEKFSNKFTKNGFKEMVKEMFSEYAKESDGGGEKVDKDKEKYELNFDELMNMLDENLRGMGTFVDDWGDEVPKYIVATANSENVFYWDLSEDWSLFGAPYSMSEDELNIDMENSFEAIQTIIPKSDAFEKVSEIKGVSFAKIVSDVLTERFNSVKDAEVEDLIAKHSVELQERKDNYEKEIVEKDEQIKKLNEFKNDVLKENRIDYVNSIDNLETHEKEMLIEKIDEYTMESLETEIKIIIGEKSIKFTKGEKPKEIKDNFTKEVKDDDEISEFQKKLDKYQKKTRNEEE